MTFRILIADEIHEDGLSILMASPVLELDIKPGMGKDTLNGCIASYDGIVVGESTELRGDIFELAPRLRVIAKAGADLDNIDLQRATRRGVIVMNAPSSHVVSSGENTIALLTSICRHIPAAVESMKRGKWEKKRFQGREVAGKILGVVGFGRVGAIVARYASKGLRMNVLVYDGLVTQDKIRQQGFRAVTLNELFAKSDIISLHVPLNPDTRHILNAKAFASMKKGVIIVNTGRRGLIHENALVSSLNSGTVAGFALDVHSEVHVKDSELFDHPKVICTPDLSMATEEAHANVANSIAESVRDFFEKGTLGNTVNVPVADQAIRTRIAPYADMARRLGMFVAGLFVGDVARIEVVYRGEILNWDLTPLTTSVLLGFLQVFKGSDVNVVNANFVAEECGIKVHETASKELIEGRPSITVEVFSDEKPLIRVEGVLIRRFGEEPRIIGINEFVTEAVPAGPMLMVKNMDIPGMIAGVSGILARRQVNVAQMNLSRDCAGGTAISIINLDSPADDSTLEAIRNIEGILSVHQIIIDDLPDSDA
jgi:D-3-phosphoglycerate dehydrogenase / 2-oxoglutarate reductase